MATPAKSDFTTFRWDNFRGGLSDDPFIGAEGTFASGKNIDIRQNPKGVTLSGIVKDTGGTFTAPVVGMLDLDNYGGSGIAAYTEDGKVYKYDLGTLTWSLVWDLSSTADTNKKIFNAEGFYISVGSKAGHNIVFWTQTKMHICTPDFVTKTVDWQSFTGVTTVSRPVLKASGFVLFASDNNIYYLDGTANGIIDIGQSAPGSIDGDEIIVAMTRSFDLLRVYSRSNNSVYTNKGKLSIYSMGKLSSGPQYTMDWNGLPIRSVTNDQEKDYVITGANEYYSALYISNGQQKQLLKRFNPGSGYGLLPAISNFRGMAIMAGTDNIYTYGALMPSLPPSFTPEYSLGLSANINCFLPLTDKIFLAYNYGTTYKVGVIDKNWVPATYGYAAQGEIVSNIFINGSMYPKKKLREITVTCDTSLSNNHDGTIDIYARTTVNGSWTLITNVPVQEENITRVNANNLLNANIGNFSLIQFKAVLNAHNNGTINDHSPIFRDLQASFTDVEV